MGQAIAGPRRRLQAEPCKMCASKLGSARSFKKNVQGPLKKAGVKRLRMKFWGEYARDFFPSQ